MKDFNLEKAKAGAAVCTRDGRKVRILATDLANTEQPICAAITSKDSNGVPYEYTLQYYEDGFISHRKTVNSPQIIKDPRKEDLMMVTDGATL